MKNSKEIIEGLDPSMITTHHLLWQSHLREALDRNVCVNEIINILDEYILTLRKTGADCILIKENYLLDYFLDKHNIDTNAYIACCGYNLTKMMAETVLENHNYNADDEISAKIWDQIIIQIITPEYWTCDVDYLNMKHFYIDNIDRHNFSIVIHAYINKNDHDTHSPDTFNIINNLYPEKKFPTKVIDVSTSWINPDELKLTCICDLSSFPEINGRRNDICILEKEIQHMHHITSK